MKVMILGGDGFIGSHLRDAHIKRDDSVVVVDECDLRSKKCDSYKFHKFDISINMTALDDLIYLFKPDIAYNCVAIANPGFYTYNPIDTFNIDFDLNYNIIRELSGRNIPFVHFSTSEVYGRKQLTDNYNEETSDLILGPSHKLRWIYATSKILLEQLILANFNKSKTDCIIVRPFNFIGHDIDWIPAYHGQKEWIPRVYSCFMNSLLDKIDLQVVSPGTQQRCYTYIDDAIEALLSIIDNWNKCKGKVINIGAPQNEIEILELAKLMISLMNEIREEKYNHQISLIDGTKLYGDGYDDSQRRVPDVSLINQLTGWKAKTELRDMFKQSMIKTINSFI